MNLLEKISLIERVDALIHRKSTGEPSRLALRLGISERNTYNLINTMKDMGAPIYFCKVRNSYCYEHEGRFSFGFKVSERSFTGGKTSSWPYAWSLQHSCSGGQYFW